MNLVGAISMWILFIVVGAFISVMTVTATKENAEKQENRFFGTLDRLISGQDVQLEELRGHLAMGIYPAINEWAVARGVPEDRLDEIVKKISAEIRGVTVRISLPREISDYAKPPATTATDTPETTTPSE